MKQKEVTILLEDGVHARPAAIFVQNANKYSSKILLKKDDIEVNGKSIMNIMMLALTYGTKLSIITEGDDEDIAAENLADLVTNNFNI